REPQASRVVRPDHPPPERDLHPRTIRAPPERRRSRPGPDIHRRTAPLRLDAHRTDPRVAFGGRRYPGTRGGAADRGGSPGPRLASEPPTLSAGVERNGERGIPPAPGQRPGRDPPVPSA